MKKMTKMMAVAIAAVAIFFTTQVKAQTSDANKLRLGIGLEGGIPTGDAHTGSNFELGGTARLQYGLSSNFALTFTSGYYDFFAKTVTLAIPDGNGGFTTVSGKGPNVGVVPVKFGIKDFFAKNIYFGAEAGVGFETVTGGNTKLLLSPALGWADKSWDFGVRYENFSGQGDNYGVVALRVAYGFSL